MSFRALVRRALESPDLIVYGVLALVNGYYIKLLFFILRKRVKIGRWFRVAGRFYVMGSGQVIIGDNCMINSKLIKQTCFMPVYPDSVIEIGNNVTFSGTSIQCYKSVKIEDDCAIANAYIVDSPAHHLSADRKIRGDEGIVPAPVKISRNVWLSVNTVVTHGVTIGENSVIGACALVREDVRPNSLYAGVPAKFIREIPGSAAATSDSTQQKVERS